MADNSFAHVLRTHNQAWIGAKIGGYTIRQLLGSGGAGAVFKATHDSLATTAALQLFFPLNASSERLIGVTIRAIRALASLRHTGIAELYDFGFVDAGRFKCPYLVHECISGEDLFSWCRRNRPTEHERIRIALGMAEALYASHKCKFIGEYGFQQTGIAVDRSPVLVDFMVPDLQRMRAHSSTEDQLRGWRKTDGEYRYFDRSTAWFGTPGYMPPGQEVDGIVTTASGVFGLGRTFERLLWERPVEHVMAFEEEEEMATPWASLVHKMVLPQPNDRPSMEEVLRTMRGLSTSGSSAS